MTMSSGLFSAILAMDSYNRGYNSGLAGLLDVPGTQIGDATIIDSAVDPAAQQDGFYAIAYSWNGKIAISFRGTDDFTSLDGANDILSGWVQGVGNLVDPID